MDKDLEIPELSDPEIIQDSPRNKKLRLLIKRLNIFLKKNRKIVYAALIFILILFLMFSIILVRQGVKLWSGAWGGATFVDLNQQENIISQLPTAIVSGEICAYNQTFVEGNVSFYDPYQKKVYQDYVTSGQSYFVSKVPPGEYVIIFQPLDYLLPNQTITSFIDCKTVEPGIPCNVDMPNMYLVNSESEYGSLSLCDRNYDETFIIDELKNDAIPLPPLSWDQQVTDTTQAMYLELINKYPEAEKIEIRTSDLEGHIKYEFYNDKKNVIIFGLLNQQQSFPDGLYRWWSYSNNDQGFSNQSYKLLGTAAKRTNSIYIIQTLTAADWVSIDELILSLDSQVIQAQPNDRILEIQL